MDIKKEHLGKLIFSKNLGCLIELTDKSKNIFIRENRFDLFESIGLDKLEPIKGLKISELREKAEGLGIETEGLKKQELIKAIDDLSTETND